MVEEDAPQKRGRKPKAATVAAEGAAAEPKKRGRKPTTKVIEFEEGADANECIIAHLRLDPQDISKIVSRNAETAFLTGTARTAPATTVAQQTAECINLELSEGEVPKGTLADAAKSAEQDETIQRLQARIRHLEEELHACKESAHSLANSPNPFSAKKCVESGAKFHNPDNNNLWADRTGLACWWCCHAYDSVPLGLPDSYKDGVYNTVGCFCSLNCAKAYNNEMTDYRKHERLALLHQIKAEVDPSNKFKLHAAPPRQALQLFGGPLSIEEFRSHACMVTIETKFKLPPLISNVGVVEQTARDMPINHRLRLSRMMNNNGPIIRRSKPLPNSTKGIFGIVKD